MASVEVTSVTCQREGEVPDGHAGHLDPVNERFLEEKRYLFVGFWTGACSNYSE
jgi:hypothetical protein